MKTCKTCGSPLQIRETRKTSEQLKKQYYYTAYYFCPTCQKLYHDEEFKVVNKNSDLFSEKDHGLEGNPDIEIWTDGACVFNGTDRASAAWAFVSGRFENAGRVKGKQTNNTAEAYAIYHALLWAVEEGHKHILIHSDSQISIGNLKKPYEMVKENQEIFRLISEVIEANSLTVRYKKVLGHSGDPNNDRVDRLANDLASSPKY